MEIRDSGIRGRCFAQLVVTLHRLPAPIKPRTNKVHNVLNVIQYGSITPLDPGWLFRRQPVIYQCDMRNRQPNLVLVQTP